jgi:hypothetical protein
MKHTPEVVDDIISVFVHVLTGGDLNKSLAAELMRKLGPQARRDLRAACQEVENLLDDITLEEMRFRRPWKL